MNLDYRDKIEKRLKRIYKDRYDPQVLESIMKLPSKYDPGNRNKSVMWDEKDLFLITYGDSIRERSIAPLETLDRFLDDWLPEFNIIHILPFFPYSSDDGFSVIDFRQVNPDLGHWGHIKRLKDKRDLMFDLVINHVSSKSHWFLNYLNGEGRGSGFFIEVDPGKDLSGVVRPRSLPLLTKVNRGEKERYVWTTFSADQVDLDFRNPEVLVEMLDVLLFYLHKGARVIRLDAIAYLWKEIGTSCIHLPETHEIVKLMRDLVGQVDPSVLLLTETNVPNRENLSYFGNGDEAHMIYQFSLPPLLLHALFTGNSEYLNRWALSIPDPGPGMTYFNFTASHDGIGVRPLEGLLPGEEVDQLISSLKDNGAFVNTRLMPDGTSRPYELNVTYFDALKHTAAGKDEYHERRFLCSQTVMMSLKGIPAFYIHSLIATPNFFKGVKETGHARTINRRKWERKDLEQLLNRDTAHSRVMNELKRRIRIRKSCPLFHPDAGQEVLPGDGSLFVLRRYDKVGGELVSVSNLSGHPVQADPSAWMDLTPEVVDLLGEGTPGRDGLWRLEPYQTLWLTSKTC